MTHRRVGQPHETFGVVGAVPDTAGAGHLVLPLRQITISDLASPEVVVQRMLALVMTEGVAPQIFPAFLRRPRSLRAEQLPPLDGIIGGKTYVPLRAGRWWRHTLTAPLVLATGAHIVTGVSSGISIGLD